MSITTEVSITTEAIMAGVIKTVAAAALIGGGGVVLNNAAINSQQDTEIHSIQGDLHTIKCGVFNKTAEDQLECIGDPNYRQPIR